jgi:uncharacterized repeat protein (TIGR02543 family)
MADYPGDPTRAGYEFEDWYTLASGGSVFEPTTISAGITNAYAHWTPLEGPEPAGPIVEQVTLKNSWFVAYRYELPEGRYWEDYATIKVDYQLDAATLSGGVPRAIRLLGNYKETDFAFYDGTGTGANADQHLAILNYNTIGNNPYIMNQLGSSWDAGAFPSVLGGLGVTAVADEWFTLTYPTDGTGANATFNTANIPDAQDEGPFYFGIGLPGQDSVNTFLVSNVRLVGITLPNDVKIDDVIGTPFSFLDPYDVEYAPFVGYGSANGNDGFLEAKRVIISGEPEEGFPVIDITYTTYTITKDPNYPTDATETPITTTEEETDKNAYLSSTQLAALAKVGAPVKNGSYAFKGWYTAASGGTAVTTSTKFAASRTIYGQWNLVIKPTPIAPIVLEGDDLDFTTSNLGQGSGAIAVYALPDEATENAYSKVKLTYTVTGVTGTLKLIFKAAANGSTSDWGSIGGNNESYHDKTTDGESTWEYELIDGFTHIKIQDNSGGGGTGTVVVTKIEIIADEYRPSHKVVLTGQTLKAAAGGSWNTMLTINTGDVDISEYSAYIIEFKMYKEDGTVINPANYGPGNGTATTPGLGSSVQMKFSAKENGANDAAEAGPPAVPAAVPVYNVGDRFNGGNGPDPAPNAVLSGALLSLPLTGAENSFEASLWDPETDVIKCMTFQRTGGNFNTEIAEFEIISITFYE